jgi:hypothetical protein
MRRPLRPGTFAWWARLAGRKARQFLVPPEAKRDMGRPGRTILRLIRTGRMYWRPKLWPWYQTRALPRYMRPRDFWWSDILRYFGGGVRAYRIDGRIGRTLTVFIPAGAKGCRAVGASTSFDRVWQLYCRHPTSPVAQAMLVACANRLRRRGRPAVVSGRVRPVTLGALGRVQNVEVRRVLVEVRGVQPDARLLIASDQGGELYRVADGQLALHVRCPSTGRRYWLGVPDQSRWSDGSGMYPITTAQQARLWTLGIDDVRGKGVVVELVAER